MIRVYAVVLTLLLAVASASARQDARPPAGAASAVQPSRSEDPDLAALRADLARARTLVGQMERNVAFVDSGLTPLKHQFQLEIEMWNILINDMQRRLNAAGRRNAAALDHPKAGSSPQ